MENIYQNSQNEQKKTEKKDLLEINSKGISVIGFTVSWVIVALIVVVVAFLVIKARDDNKPLLKEFQQTVEQTVEYPINAVRNLVSSQSVPTMKGGNLFGEPGEIRRMFGH